MIAMSGAEKRKGESPAVFDIRNSFQKFLLAKDYIRCTSVYEMEALKAKLIYINKSENIKI